MQVNHSARMALRNICLSGAGGRCIIMWLLLLNTHKVNVWPSSCAAGFSFLTIALQRVDLFHMGLLFTCRFHPSRWTVMAAT